MITKFNEACDIIFIDKDKEFGTHFGEEHSIPFTILESQYGEFVVALGEYRTTHGDMEDDKNSEYNELLVKFDYRYEYRGRLFLESKVMSFWDYPDTGIFEKCLSAIKERVDKYNDNHSVAKRKEINWSEWKIEIINSDVTGMSFGFNPDEVSYIPISEYTGSEKQPDEWYKRHTESPMKKKGTAAERMPGWKPKKLKYQMGSEPAIVSKRRLKNMYQEMRFAKFNEYLLESASFQTSKDFLIDLIENRKGFVKMRRMREKYKDYLDKLDNFTESNQTIEKKELTKIKNDLDKLYGAYYGGDKEFHDQRSEELKKIAIDKGVSPYAYENTDPAIGALGNLHNYSMSDAERNDKKIGGVKLTKKEQAFVDKYYSNFDKWAEISNKIIEIRKVLNPTAKERKEKELKAIKGKLNPKIKNAIDEIAEDFRKVIESTELNSYEHSLKRFREEHGDSFPNVDTQSRKFRWFGVNNQLYLKPKDAGYNYYYDLTLIDNYQEKMEKIAKRVSEQAILSFQRKMYDKIGGLVSDIDRDFKVDVIGSDISYNDINFVFDDNSKFSIRNKIVSKFSNQGTFFYTYPTTFHDAYLPDGERIPNPNEYTVKDAFNTFYNDLKNYNL